MATETERALALTALLRVNREKLRTARRAARQAAYEALFVEAA